MFSLHTKGFCIYHISGMLGCSYHYCTTFHIIYAIMIGFWIKATHQAEYCQISEWVILLVNYQNVVGTAILYKNKTLYLSKCRTSKSACTPCVCNVATVCAFFYTHMINTLTPQTSLHIGLNSTLINIPCNLI